MGREYTDGPGVFFPSRNPVIAIGDPMPELDTLALPVLPLAAGVVLPNTVATLTLDKSEALAAVAAANDGDGRVLLVPRCDGRYARVGTVAHVEESGELPNGTASTILRGLQLFTL